MAEAAVPGSLTLNPAQSTAVAATGTIFLLGPAGSGKSTALYHRLLALLAAGEPAYTLLTLIAEPDHEADFLDAIHRSGQGPYADLKVLTYNRLAQEMVVLFWPLVARAAGFHRPFQPPTVLNYDLAQLLMWSVVDPWLGEGALADLRLRPQQIVSQLLDTLNRAALNRLSLEDAFQRQIDTWLGEPDRPRHLAEAVTAARRFRDLCFERSLLDLSLVVEVFDRHVVGHPEFRRYFSERFRHLLVDNIEEHTPVGQRFVAELMDVTESTAVAYDSGGGYKRFLAADPLAANRFRALSQTTIEFDHPFVDNEPLRHLALLVSNALLGTREATDRAGEAIITVVDGRYRREMVARLMPVLRRLVDDGVAPDDIAIITPYLDGALRYMLEQALDEAGLPFFLHRRRSSPREEPRVRAWLTWLALAHPQWGIVPHPYDVSEALTLSIAHLDPARAALLTDRLYDDLSGQWQPVETLDDATVERVGQAAIAQVGTLQEWLAAQPGDEPPDVFLHRLFNELLALPPFQPTPDLAGAAVCDWLVQTAGRLRHAAPAIGWDTPTAVGEALINGINQGLVAANPPELGIADGEEGVMLSTMYAYLLTGRIVRVQVWLETAAVGWWDIPRQPLSNAFVLAESRDPERPWDSEEEFAIRNQLLSRIIRGLTNRCRDGIILATSDLDRRGQRQDGPLWRALRPVLPETAVPPADIVTTN